MGVTYEQDGLLGAGVFGRPLPVSGVYRHRPTEVRAIKFTGGNFDEIVRFFGDGSVRGIYGPTEKNPDHLILTKANGERVPCHIGNWVLPDSEPETFLSWESDDFENTYESSEQKY